MASAAVSTPAAFNTVTTTAPIYSTGAPPPVNSSVPHTFYDGSAAIDSNGAAPPLVNSSVPHTFYDDVDPAHFLGAHGGVTDLMLNRQNLKLRRYFWPAPNATSILIFAHGHGAHLFFELLHAEAVGQPLTYKGSWVEALNAAGVSVAGIDNQGHGRSEALHGLRFYVESFDDYVNDVLQLVDDLPNAASTIVASSGFSSTLPVFLGGISLGGQIAFRAARASPPDRFKGVILLAPMISLRRASRKGMNPYLRPLAAVLSVIVPTAPLVATDKNTMYPDIQALWDGDPLTVIGKTRVRNANEYLRVTEEAMNSLHSVEFPFLVFHSENDTMCDCDGSKQLYLQAKSEDKTLRLVNDMWHVLVREKGHEHVLAEVIEWIAKRT